MTFAYIDYCDVSYLYDFRSVTNISYQFIVILASRQGCGHVRVPHSTPFAFAVEMIFLNLPSIPEVYAYPIKLSVSLL